MFWSLVCCYLVTFFLCISSSSEDLTPCDDGTYPEDNPLDMTTSDSVPLESYYECLPCHYSCGNCSGAGNLSCTSCREGYYKEYLMDTPMAEMTTVDSVTKSLTIYCLPCHDTCGTCSGAGNLSCTSCREGYYKEYLAGTPMTDMTTSDSVTKPLESYYECLPCHDTCGNCSGAGNLSCTSCREGYYKEYLAGTPMTDMTTSNSVTKPLELYCECRPCHDTCANCSGAGNLSCTSCREGYYKEYLTDTPMKGNNTFVCVELPPTFTNKAIIIIAASGAAGVLCIAAVVVVICLCLRRRRRGRKEAARIDRPPPSKTDLEKSQHGKRNTLIPGRKKNLYLKTSTGTDRGSTDEYDSVRFQTGTHIPGDSATEGEGVYANQMVIRSHNQEKMAAAQSKTGPPPLLFKDIVTNEKDIPESSPPKKKKVPTATLR